MSLPEKPVQAVNKLVPGAELTSTRRFTIAQREPWSLPEAPIELPAPKQAPSPPAPVNLLTTLLPPILMVVGMVVIPMIAKDNTTLSIVSIAPMVLMGLGFPLANLIGVSSQKKKYAIEMQNRESLYHQALDNERNRISSLLLDQKNTLEREYPTVDQTALIAFNQNKRLWWRRQMDSDFLSLRVGIGAGKPSFTVSPPRIADPNEPLTALSLGLIDSTRENPDIPLLLNLAKSGSVAISAKTSTLAYDLTRRLVLDILVHHSPLDVHLALIADTRDAEERWRWLKWAPHTAAITSDEKPRRLNYSEAQIDEYLKWLVNEYNLRNRAEGNISVTAKRKGSRMDIVLILDDSGIARQSPEIAQIAQNGFEVGIFLIFAGGQNWPNSCRSRLEISGNSSFQFIETWDMGSKAVRFQGKMESVSIDVCEKVSRSLAGLEVIGGLATAQLPDNVRLSQVVGNDALESEAIMQKWSMLFKPEDQLQFPIGLCANRDQLDLAIINLLPEQRGGVDAYHTILIGTTGSGKSEFMKSVVMGAAVRYPPTLLNFFFLDFKGGAAFNVFENLPHVSGIVTNLKPELVDRGLESIRSEIDRRQEKFAQAQVQNIWGYNLGRQSDPLPHLVLFLDEFARGLADFPSLRETLDLLVRQGRSLGMYLILANQDTNSEVDRLLNNVGWRIALKVGKPEEISMIDRALMNTPGGLPNRAGQGYLRSIKGSIIKFQAGYGGFNVLDKSTIGNDEFTIFSVEDNGSFVKLYKNKAMIGEQNAKNASSITEEEKIISSIKEATNQLGIQTVDRIYLDPLPEKIDLSDVIEETSTEIIYREKTWLKKHSPKKELVAHIGYLDIPNECKQEILKIDFNQQDGNLWIVGGPGSGKVLSVTTLMMSLSLSYTPEEVQFYVLDFGTGSLRTLDCLPHTGSVIRLQEKERIQRLLKFLDNELDHRSSHETLSEVSGKCQPQIFLIINNFAEMRTNYPDEAEKISRYIRDGKASRMHVIITTNRGAELSRNISSNIARKLVLQLSSKDEYLDVIGKNVPVLGVRSEGRGYWQDEVPHEVQVCNTQNLEIKNFVREMNHAWDGVRPIPIETIPTCISLEDLSDKLKSSRQKSVTRLPIGIAYEDLSIVHPDLLREMHHWLILGPRESGKSNLLACMIKHFGNQEEKTWDITAISFRRSPISEIELSDETFHYGGNPAAAVEKIKALGQLIAATKENSGKNFLLIIDDLGALFESGMEEVTSALNAIIPLLTSRQDVYLAVSGLLDELRSQIASPIIKILRQSRTGMVFSKDTSELDWLGATIPMEYRKLEFPQGRGFFVSKGKAILVQTPFIGKCAGRKDQC